MEFLLILETIDLFKINDFHFNKKLGDAEKELQFIPVKIQATWSRSMSVIYLTMADCTSVTASLPVLRKVCQTLSLKWEDKSLDPPFVESVSKHFTFKSLKKMALISPKQAIVSPKKSFAKESLNQSPIKLSKAEKESLMQLYKYAETASPTKYTDLSLSRNVTPTRKSTSPFRIEKFSNEYM